MFVFQLSSVCAAARFEQQRAEWDAQTEALTAERDSLAAALAESSCRGESLAAANRTAAQELSEVGTNCPTVNASAAGSLAHYLTGSLSHCPLSHCLTVSLSPCPTVSLSPCPPVSISHCLNISLARCLTVPLSQYLTAHYLTVSLAVLYSLTACASLPYSVAFASLSYCPPISLAHCLTVSLVH